MTNPLVFGLLMLIVVILSIVCAYLWYFYRIEKEQHATSIDELRRADIHSVHYISALDKVLCHHHPSRELQSILSATYFVMLKGIESQYIRNQISNADVDYLHSNNELAEFFADLHGIYLNDSTMKDDLSELIYHSVRYVLLRWNDSARPCNQLTIADVRNNLEKFISIIVTVAAQKVSQKAAPQFSHSH